MNLKNNFNKNANNLQQSHSMRFLPRLWKLDGNPFLRLLLNRSCLNRIKMSYLCKSEGPAFKHEFIDVLVVFAQALYMLLELLSFACLCELLDDAVGNVHF